MGSHELKTGLSVIKWGKKKEGWGETKRRGEREGMGGERGEEIT